MVSDIIQHDPNCVALTQWKISFPDKIPEQVHQFHFFLSRECILICPAIKMLNAHNVIDPLTRINTLSGFPSGWYLNSVARLAIDLALVFFLSFILPSTWYVYIIGIYICS